MAAVVPSTIECISSSQSRASVASWAMSWRNASSSSRRPPPASRGCAARRDVRFAGASADEVRELIAQCEQVVVLGRESAQLLLLGQRTAQETARGVEPPAERVETGEVVSSVGGGT